MSSDTPIYDSVRGVDEPVQPTQPDDDDTEETEDDADKAADPGSHPV